MNIAILLATYNSSSFLSELIDSLLNQTYQNFTIYIRDDGSFDNTSQIIQTYLQHHQNIRFVLDPIHNRGAMGSFIYLLEHVSADYYLFCDHDDVWMPDKIEQSLKVMQDNEMHHPDKPIIVCCDLQVVDRYLNPIADSFWKLCRLSPPLILSSKYYLSVCNFIPGCTMMLNQAVKQQSLPIGKNALMHDSWIALKVLSAGGLIIPLDISLIKYRQHEQNAVGALSPTGIYYRIFHLGIIIRCNYNHYKMAHEANGMTMLQFYYYRILYFLRR